MRILYWIGQIGDKFGSYERYQVLLAEKCRQRGHEILIVHDLPNTVPEYRRRLEAAGSTLLVLGDTYKKPLQALSNMARLVHAWKADVVHVHFVNPLALPMLKLVGVPLVYQTWHTSIDHAISPLTRVIRFVGGHCTRRMLAVSERVRRDEIRAGVSPNHIRTLYLGLPMRDFIASAEAHTSPLPSAYGEPSLKVVITVARFYPQKGMKYVIPAAIQVLKERADVLWWLVGEGPEKESLQAFVQRAGLQHRLLFLGVRNDVPCLMRRAYAQVMGSLYEGLGMITLEAGAFGVPTVGTQIGGLDEAVVHGVTGLLVPRASSESLARATLRLIDDSDLRDRLGEAARRMALARFDAEPLIDELLDMYESDYAEFRRA